MKVRLLRDQRIRHAAGEIVDVPPAVYNFLINTKSAVPVEAEKTEKPDIPDAGKKAAAPRKRKATK